jgi:hypothetical protein
MVLVYVITLPFANASQRTTMDYPKNLETVRVLVLPDGRMTRKNAALYLGVSVKTLAHWAMQGKGPVAIYIGRRAYYRREALDAFIANGVCRGGQTPVD